ASPPTSPPVSPPVSPPTSPPAVPPASPPASPPPVTPPVSPPPSPPSVPPVPPSPPPAPTAVAAVGFMDNGRPTLGGLTAAGDLLFTEPAGTGGRGVTVARADFNADGVGDWVVGS